MHRPTPNFLRFHSPAVICAALFGLACVAAGPSTQPQDQPDNSRLPIAQRINGNLMNDGNLADLEARLRATAATSAQDRSDLVGVLMEQGRLADAIPFLKQAVEDHPDDAASWTRLADIHDWLGDLAQAKAALQSAIERQKDPELAIALRLRLALVQFDEDSPQEAVASLKQAAAARPDTARQAALICYLYGRYGDVASFLNAQSQNDPKWLLLAGNAALRSGQAQEAADLFQKAAANPDTPAQARYSIERIVSASRALKQLPQLADAWLAKDKLPPNYWTPLAIVLRDTGRIDDLLRFWESNAAGSSDAPNGFASEVISAASFAGKKDVARKICLRILDREPENAYWLKFTTRALCDWGDAPAASDLLGKQVKASSDPATLRRLAMLARDLGLRAVVADAANKLINLGDNTAAQGMLLKAESDARFADYTAANASLTAAAEFARTHPADLNQVAGALEFAGRIDDSIALLQTQDIHTLSNDEQSRLAALLAQQGKFAAASRVYEFLRHTASSEALRSQFAMMMLDNAIAADELPKTIADLKALVAGGHGTPEDVVVLADALSRDKQLPAAIELLRGNSIMNEMARLQQLSILLLRAKHRDDAVPVLRKMVEVDPDGAIEHLEELAVSATDAHDVSGAEEYVAEIRRRVGAGQAAFEALGHVYDRLNRQKESAVAYRRAIAIGPENGNLWLQWTTTMSKSGQTDFARQRLQVLAGQARDEPLFGIAADAVLNLRPPPYSTQSLRRQAILRLAADPQSMLILHVVSDLADELRENDFETRSIEAGMPFNDDERDQRLRDLSAIAIDHPDNLQETLNVGRSMMLIGDHFPPKEYIDLGTAMLDAHRPADGLIFLDRAVQETIEDRVALHVVDTLAQFGQYDPALTVAIPLKPRHAFDPNFRLDMAQIEESAGQIPAAFQDYSATLDIELRQISAQVTSEVEGEQKNNLRLATDGAITTVRSPRDSDALLGMLSARASESGPAVDTSLAIFRQVAFALHRPEAVEQLMANPPADSTFAAIRGRIEAGLIDSAIAFAKSHNAAAALPAFSAWIEDFPADTLANQNRLPANPNYVSLAIRSATAMGDIAQALRLAQSFPFTGGPSDAGFYALCINTAERAGDNQLADKLVLKVIASALSGPRGASTNAMLSIANNWRLLDASGRISAQELLQAKFAESRDANSRGAFTKELLALAALNHRPIGNDLALAVSLLPTARDANSVAEIFVLTPPSARPELVAELARRLPVNQRLNVYLACVAVAFDPLDDATVRALAHAISALPPQNQAVWNRWCYNVAQGSNLGLIADAVSKIAPDPGTTVASIAPTVSCAMALSLAGRTADADAKAKLAIDHLRQWTSDSNIINQDYFAFEMTRDGDPPSRAYMLRIALSAMSPAGRQALDQNLNNLPDTGGADQRSNQTPAHVAWELTYKAMVKESIGDQPASLAFLKEGLRLAPDNPSIQKLYSEWLSLQGHYQELIWAFPDAFTGALADRRLSELLTTAAANLYRTEGKFHSSSLETVIVLPHFSYDAWVGDTTGLRDALVQMLQMARSRPRIPIAPQWGDPSAGGLEESAIPRCVELLSEQPGTLDEILSVWSFPPVRQAAWTRDLLSRALAHDPSRVRVLLAELEKRATARETDNSDRDLLSVLVGLPGVVVSQAMIDDAWRAAIFKPGDETFGWVTTLLSCQRDNGSQPATRPTQPTRRRSFGAPIFGGPLPDEWASMVISQSLNANGPAGASDQLNSMIQVGSILPMRVKVQIQTARIAAESGDWKLMRSRIRAAIFAWKGQPPPNVTSSERVAAPEFQVIVPSSFQDPQAVDLFCDAMLGEIQDGLNRWPSENELVAALARVGGRLQAVGQEKAARIFLTASEQHLSHLATGDQTLCVADLAERLGDHATAQRLKIECLRARCLPIARIPALLASIDAGTRNELRQFVPANIADVTTQTGASEAAQ